MADVVPRLVVLPPEFAGASGYLDDVGGGHTFTLDQDGHALLGLRIGADCTDAFTFLKIDAEGYKPYRKDGVLIRAGRDRQIRVGVPADPGRYGDTILEPLQPQTPAVTPSRYALRGRLGITANGRFKDATGLRRGLFTSDFPILHIWDIDAEEAERSNQKVAAAGWQGERNFIELAVDNGVPAGPGTFWHGRHVSHDMTMRNAPRHLDSLRALGLKMGVTKGNRWRSDQEEFDHLAEFCELVVRLGHQETIAWLEILGNEAIINHKYGKMGVEVPNPDYDPNDPHSTPTYTDYSKAVAYAQPMAKLVRDTIGCLTSMGSFDESGHTLKQIKTGVDLVDVHHAWPDPNLGCKHIHTVADYCHYKGEIPNKGILQGENRGVNDPYPFGSLCGNVSTAVNDREDVFTLTAIEQLTNQLSVHLTGPSIRHFCSLDSVEWSFNELPDLMQHIPEDIGAWQGRSFFTNGNKFCWAGRTEWDQMQNPPFNVEHWQTISSKGIEKEGDGIVALRAAMTAKGYIVKGTKS